jgi:hypothetical protein
MDAARYPSSSRLAKLTSVSADLEKFDGPAVVGA